MKKCSKCKQVKPLSDFAKDKHSGSGYCYQCKLCQALKKRKPNSKIRGGLNDSKLYGNGLNIIYLASGQEVLVDEEDYPYLITSKWSQYSNGYACEAGTRISMHRKIVNAKKGEIVDHINGNIFDNRKCNLRICSKSQNCMHRVNLPSNNTSGHMGVSYCNGPKRRKRWLASIVVNGKTKYLGMFLNIEDAIMARKEAENIYFGIFKPLLPC